MAAAPLITPAPGPAPTLFDLVERQQVTTISVVASSTPSGASDGSSTTEKKGFPVAVAIPALVGGMAAAFGAFGLWWWCTKRNKRQRRERWEAAQRKKQRARANSAGRPSISSSRGPSATNLKGMAEKDVIPPVPALPKHYPPQPQQQAQGQGQGQGQGREREKRQSYGNGNGIGYGGQPNQYQYNQRAQDPYAYPQDQQHQHQYQPPTQYAQGYSTQPTIDGPISPTYSDHSTASGSGSTGSGSGSTSAASTDLSTPKETRKVSPTKSGSRSTARVAVADSAAATAGLDANVRYQPKKPSPLALKAQAEKDALNARMGANRPMSGGYGDQEMLAPENQYQSQSQFQSQSQSQGQGQGGRNVMSGEWGVALGSPNHDPSSTFSFAEQQSTYQSQPGQNRYSNDPYLSAQATTRAPSGQYSNDPYAGYHDPIVNAASTGKKSNWV